MTESMDFTTAVPSEWSRCDAACRRGMPVLLAAYFVFLVLFGAEYHVMEIPYSAEWDGYALKADALRAGAIPRDPYRPLLYPLLSAMAGEVFDDSFAGGRLISCIFACLFVFVLWRTGRIVFGEPVAAAAAVIVMLNFNVVTYGMSVSTDMTFAALAITVLLVSLLTLVDPSPRKAVLAGFVFAMSFFTRYSAIFILPIPLTAILIGGSRSKLRGRLLPAGVFMISALLFLIPHFVLNHVAFGSPLYNENWKNLSFKLYGEGDWAYFKSVPFRGLFDVIKADPLRLLRSTVSELARFFTSTLYFLGGRGAAGYIFAIAGTSGFVMMIRRADRQKVIVILFLFLLVAGGCTVFFSGVRFMLPVLPLYYLVIADCAFLGIASRGIGALSGLKPAVVRTASIALAVALVGTTIWSGVRHIGMFIDAHPVAELEAAKMLEKRYGADITVLGTYPFMQRYVDYRYVELEHAQGAERTSAEAYYDRLKRQVLEEEAALVIVGRSTISSRPLELLDAGDAAAGPPDFLVPISGDERVALYEVVLERQ